ncbi:protein FAM53B-like, partial [Hippocampus comes]|uniref:protein FAM53B-like n=1 Tax=Hippocampus comes TaxID=109280 RepID=UPI00094F15D0
SDCPSRTLAQDDCPWPPVALPDETCEERCVTMVIIFSKSLEKKKGVNDVRPKSSERQPRERHTMSRGTTLFSCGSAGELSTLYGGGSVRAGGGFSGGHCLAMQRSSSFSFPSRTSISTDGPLDLPFFNQRLPAHPHFTASPVSPTTPSSQFPQSYRGHCLRPLSLSHEQISLPQLQREEASEASSPDSTPELGRRSGQRGDGKGCLSRSRSQPCVLNDKKIGMKRRRPEDAQEQRPSLDLAKMTQQLQTFQSLSCPGFSFFDTCQSSLPPSRHRQLEFTAVSELGLEPRQEAMRDGKDSSDEELDSDSACSVGSRSGSPREKIALWKGDRASSRDIFQLGGELDLEQIERN